MPPLGTLNKTALTLAVTQAVAMSSAQAATIRVNDFSDVNGSGCTLRQAITSANDDSAPVGSNCVAGSGNDIIRFDNTEAQTISLANGELYIDSNMEILAPFHSPIMIDGSQNGSFNIFDIQSSIVTLDHLTIKNAEIGGVVLGNNATVTISNSTVSDNGAVGVYLQNPGATTSRLTINRSTIANNVGGIRTYDATNINYSTISGNSGVSGGGFTIGGGTTTIANSTISNNTAAFGGGIYNKNSSLNLNNNIIAGNISTNNHAELSSIASTITSVNNVIGSSATTNAQAFYNFIPSGTDINANNTDGLNIALTGILDPVLTDNGGPTHTHNLVTGSAAIDKISGTECNNNDQRNESRSVYCDLGAVEYLPIGQTIVVDTPMGNNTAAGTCSLSQAIQTVNTNREYGNCEIGGVNDVISFDGATDSVTLTAGLPTITADVSIQGTGTTIDAAGVGRVLDIALGPKAELDDLVLTGGSFSGYGAGVAVNFESDVTIINSTITGNTSSNRGGGIAVSNLSTIRVIDSTISGNTASQNGGGVAARFRSRIEINRSTISGNKGANGGGVAIDGGSVYIADSLLHKNSTNGAAFSTGGGLFVRYLGAVATITNSTISGNSSRYYGGGIALALGAETSITNSTIVENIGLFNGGLFADDDANSYASFQNSIFRNTRIEIGSNTDNHFNSLGNNLFGDSSKDTSSSFVFFTPAGTDIIATSDGTKPKAASGIFRTLSDNGGPTLTHALVSGSPALNAANNADCPANDQRGEKRDAKCDIGAFELQDDSSFFVVPLPNGKSVIFGL